MGLEFFYDETFSLATDLDPVDSFVGDGGVTYTLVKKSGNALASTITAANLQYYQFNGGFTKLGNTFTLSSAPAIGAQIVAPGIVALTFTVFDQDVVDGVTNPRVQEIPFWLGDGTQPHIFSYTNLPQFPGIRISFVNLVSAAGADLTWVQLACSDPLTGLAMTYAATGEPIYTAAIQAYGTLSASSAAGASSISTTSAPQFWEGDYVVINRGSGTEEIRKIASKTSTTLTFFTAMDYSHSSGQLVHAMGRKFWARVEVPLNASNNQAFNFWNLGLRRQARNNSKV